MVERKFLCGGTGKPAGLLGPIRSDISGPSRDHDLARLLRVLWEKYTAFLLSSAGKDGVDVLKQRQHRRGGP